MSNQGTIRVYDEFTAKPNSAVRRWQARHRADYVEKMRAADIERRYNLPIEVADFLRDHPCEICGATPPSVLDHDHDQKVLRGVLCTRCNTAIGLFRDDIELLKAAIAYLSFYEYGDPHGVTKTA